MLRQDISFFDVIGYGSAEMTSRVSLHPQRIQDLLLTNLGLILVVIADFVSCSILSLAHLRSHFLRSQHVAAYMVAQL